MTVINLTEGFAPFGTSPSISETTVKRSRIFAGGEVDFSLDITYPHFEPHVMITTRLQSSDDIMTLLMATDAVRRQRRDAVINLFFPYCPYARADRIFKTGEPFSLEVFARLINSQRYESVRIFDGHSVVASSLIDRCVDISNVQFAANIINHHYLSTHKHFFLVAPDASAAKKVQALWDKVECGNGPVTYFKKRGDDGAIANLWSASTNLRGWDAWVVDDICDGGRTFIALAHDLKAMGAAKIYLIVSHGLFTYGLRPLADAGITHVYTTDSFDPGWHDVEKANFLISKEPPEFLTIVPLSDFIA